MYYFCQFNLILNLSNDTLWLMLLIPSKIDLSLQKMTCLWILGSQQERKFSFLFSMNWTSKYYMIHPLNVEIEDCGKDFQS